MKHFLRLMSLVLTVPSMVIAQQRAQYDTQGHRASGVQIEAYPGGKPGGGLRKDTTTWRALGPFGGDVEDINISPTSQNVMLAGVAPNGNYGGQLYRSSDSGASWTQVQTIGNLSVFDVEFVTNGTVWAASEDAVWVSTDNGQTFARRDLGFASQYALAVKIDPTNPQVLWAGLGSQTITNVVKSVNGGTTWVNVTPPGVSGMSCMDIAINPTNTAQVMVTLAGDFSGGAVYFTTNGGSSWDNVSAGLPGTPAHAVTYDRGRWFVTGGLLFGGQNFGLWQSINNGQIWTRLDQGWPNAVGTGIAVDPNNPNVILAATVDGVHKSIDAGQTWTISAGGTATYSMANVRFAPGSSTRVAMGVASLGVILSDNAVTNTRISSVGIGALNVFSVAANPTNTAELAIAFQALNSGGVYASTDGGITWQLQQAPPTRYSYVKFAQNGMLYALSSGPSTIAPEGVYRRNSSGTWTSLGPDQGPFYETDLLSIDFGRSNRNLFITGGSDFGAVGFEGTVWRAPDAGVTWTKVMETTSGSDAVAERVLIIPDGTDQIALAGVQSFSDPVNGVYRTVDGGLTWNPVLGTGLPTTLWGYDLTTAPDNPQIVYVTDGNFSGGGIYRSTDAGATWSPYLTGHNVRGIAVDPTSPDDIYFWSVFDAAPVYHASKNGSVLAAASTGISGGPQQIISVPGSKPRLLLATTQGTFELSLFVERPALRINRIQNKAVLSWTNAAFSLQSAPNVTGAYTNIPGATSPYTNVFSGSRQFFRLVK